MNHLKQESSLETKKHDTDDEIKTFILFNLDLEEYAVDILNIQEIHRYENISLIHNAPTYIKGFMRLRDNIIPIIDLRILYNLEIIAYTSSTIVIILNIEKKLFGIIVDGTPEILHMKASQVKMLNEFSSKIPQAYIKGVGILEDRSIVVLDIEKLLTNCDLESYKRV